jgi:6-phosphogluconolactonase (cycloisomerase 2 family)
MPSPGVRASSSLPPSAALLLLGSLLATGCHQPIRTAPPSASYRPGPILVYVATDSSLRRVSPDRFESRPGFIEAYAISPATGALGMLANSYLRGGTEPAAMIQDPRHRFDYIADISADTIRAYAVDLQTGRLQPGPVTALSPGSEAVSIALTPNGKFLYVAFQALNAVGAYAVNPDTGALTAVPGSPFPTTGTGLFGHDVAVTRDGRFLLASDTHAVYSFRINPASGALSFVSALAGPIGIQGLAMDPHGHFAYAAGSGPQAISTYILQPKTGRLSLFAAMPLPSNDSIGAFALSPDGRFAYTAQNAGIHVYRLCAGRFFSPLITGSRARATTQIALDPSGRFLLAPQGGQVNSLCIWSIDPETGRLQPLPGSPYPLPHGQRTILVTSNERVR